jgi:hypothetical protein
MPIIIQQKPCAPAHCQHWLSLFLLLPAAEMVSYVEEQRQELPARLSMYEQVRGIPHSDAGSGYVAYHMVMLGQGTWHTTW